MTLSRKIAIDLGTSNSLVFEVGRGLVLQEPTVVAVSLDDNRVLAVGTQAQRMLGRTPANIQASRPLRDGVIADYHITEVLLSYFIQRACGRFRFLRPQIMLSVPAGVTSVESRAVLDAALGAGAGKAYLLPEPLAAALGAGIPVEQASGNMIFNSGGGTTEIAIISLGGVVVSESARLAGDRLDEAIASYVRRKYELVIGEQAAERLKIDIGSAAPLEKRLTSEVKGRDSLTGLPRTVEVSSEEITEAIKDVLEGMVLAVHRVLEKTPPELASDVIDKGIVLSGGTSLLRNLDLFLTKTIGVPAHVAGDPIYCVVRGIAQALEDFESYHRFVVKK
ncbi:rod shape-determining protein [candidate division WWE3 bacterium CG08_land_8_20_14_0_20_43_13]|uniref:Cell shape-determining protein MreB n=1 Tax=candidate division WWE3 bacterium CG08_land_8_20_14_0_20_43_13 TaxID=1975087 RepID=A0A2H0X7N3_UNCKA|nr:MAG: rod shape-determining protein [candidate division WWE3 bacterium CG08_land_8_20_14_0_20_43_13]